MTRKDYELIARVLREVEHMEWSRVSGTIQEQIANLMADELAADNPRFDRARFLKACGVDS